MKKIIIAAAALSMVCGSAFAQGQVNPQGNSKPGTEQSGMSKGSMSKGTVGMSNSGMSKHSSKKSMKSHGMSK
jgi:pentapeptide MXKDX repeat protein